MQRYCLLWLLLLIGCSSERALHVTVTPVSDLVVSEVPNIASVALKNGTVVLFDKDLGWYDRERQLVEGHSVNGNEERLPISSIERLTITLEADTTSAGSPWILVLLCIVLGVALFVYEVTRLPF